VEVLMNVLPVLNREKQRCSGPSHEMKLGFVVIHYRLFYPYKELNVPYAVILHTLHSTLSRSCRNDHPILP
jgi:hypothetical protein